MSIGIALLGCGTVGSAVAEMLLTQGGHLRRRAGASFELRHVVKRDVTKVPAGVPARLLTDQLDAALKDKNVSVVIELIGGLEPARTMVLAALRSGKHVVTANKYLLAVHGREILAAARRAGKCVSFEASCGGAIPIILALTKGLVANDISRVVGIVNGTCNYILTQMTQHGQSYADALAGAQAAGYAEPDPTLDVNGTDSSHKLAILSALAFGADIDLKRVEVTGIDALSDTDLKYAREMGYVCKLLAIGEKVENANDEPRNAKQKARRANRAKVNGFSVSLRVHPTFVPETELLANVNGAFNAISVWGHASGQTLYYGRGAGPMPTASAVLADLADVAMGTAPLLFERLPVLAKRQEVAYVPSAQIVSRNYLRITALDEPGVMARIATIVGQRGISISAVTQHESKAGEPVPIVVMTHEARDGDVAAAVKAIDKLAMIKAATVRIRVLG